MTTTDFLHTETNPSVTNLARLKKLPPPPLCLPATNASTDEEANISSNEKHERNKSTNNCCLSSSLEDCSHKVVPYILPTSQRPQILEALLASSSTLLVPSSSETKHKKSSASTHSNQLYHLKQRQLPSKTSVTDAEWIDFVRLVLQKPLEHELKTLLDNYKMTYFDRVNAPNTSDETIRSSLCDMVSQALATYSSSSTVSVKINNDSTTNVSSPSTSSTITNHSSTKRKRKNINNGLSGSTPTAINDQTKFVISHIIPGKSDSPTNCHKTVNQQQQQKQFQKKYSYLFKYIPNKEEKEYLIREGHLKITSSCSIRSSNNNNICLMLYDEVVTNMDEYDLELSGISIEDSFTLPESMIAHISSSA